MAHDNEEVGLLLDHEDDEPPRHRGGTYREWVCLILVFAIAFMLALFVAVLVGVREYYGAAVIGLTALVFTIVCGVGALLLRNLLRGLHSCLQCLLDASREPSQLVHDITRDARNAA